MTRALATTALTLVLAAAARAEDTCTQEGRVTVRRGDQELPPEGAVVYVSTPLPESRAAPRTHQLLQVTEASSFAFSPEVLVVQQGDSVEFINKTLARHEVHADSDVNVFRTSPNILVTTHTQLFRYPGTSYVGCRVHDHMHASVLTVPNRFHVLVDAQGRWRLEGLPRRDLVLHFWEPNGGEVARTVPACSPAPLEVSVPARTRPAKRSDIYPSGFN